MILICGIPKHLDRKEITRLALRWGFRLYHEDEERAWYVKRLPEGVRPNSAEDPEIEGAA